MKDKANFKYNGGRGALICSECKVILKTGESFTEEEIAAIKGHQFLEAQYCLRCKLINALNEKGVEWKTRIEVREEIKYRVVTFKPPFPIEVLDVIENADVKSYGYLTFDGESGIDVYFPM